MLYRVPSVTVAGDFVCAFYQRPDGLTSPGLWTLRGYCTTAVVAPGFNTAVAGGDISLDAGIVVCTVGNTNGGNYTVSNWQNNAIFNLNQVPNGFRPTEFTLGTVPPAIPPAATIDPTTPSATDSPGNALILRVYRT